MPHSFGYRARTRQMFARGFRKAGMNPMSTYMIVYKIGDYVDIKVNPSTHKGMPFKAYHGRTGVVYNVTKRAVGLRVNKLHNGRILEKRINVRVEHIHPSKCRDELKRRTKENETLKAKARAGGERVSLKRQPLQPKAAFTLAPTAEPETIQALPFVDLV